MIVLDYPMGKSEISFLNEKKLAIQSYKDLFNELCSLGLLGTTIQDISSFFPKYKLRYNNKECTLNVRVEPYRDYDTYILFTGSLFYGKFEKFKVNSNVDYDIPSLYKDYFSPFLERIKKQLQG